MLFLFIKIIMCIKELWGFDSVDIVSSMKLLVVF